MSMTHEEFEKAFRNVISSEFSYIPNNDNDVDFTFSKKFERKMEKLIKIQRKSYWSLINTAAKRVAVIIVAMITMVAASLSVKAIREPVLRFVKQIFETFVHYSFEGDTVDTITKEYVITQLPDGFSQSNHIENDAMITTVYSNISGDTIEFTQMATSFSFGLFVDRENGEIRTQTIDDIEAEYIEHFGIKSVMWTKYGYVFALECSENIDTETIWQMIRSLQ